MEKLNNFLSNYLWLVISIIMIGLPFISSDYSIITKPFDIIGIVAISIIIEMGYNYIFNKNNNKGELNEE